MEPNHIFGYRGTLSRKRLNNLTRLNHETAATFQASCCPPNSYWMERSVKRLPSRTGRMLNGAPPKESSRPPHRLKQMLLTVTPLGLPPTPKGHMKKHSEFIIERPFELPVRDCFEETETRGIVHYPPACVSWSTGTAPGLRICQFGSGWKPGCVAR